MTHGALRVTHQLKSRSTKGGRKGEKLIFLGLYPTVRVEKRGCRERSSNFSLRSTKIGWSSSDRPRFKVGVLGEGYAWILETPSFTKVLRGRSRKSKASGSGVFAELLQVVAHVSRGRDSSYFGYFPF